jgi:hypothetical protein
MTKVQDAGEDGWDKGEMRLTAGVCEAKLIAEMLSGRLERRKRWKRESEN